MKPALSQEAKEILERISKDRTRTNLFRNPEQRAIAGLVRRIPSWVQSDLLTFIGFSGSFTILLSFILAACVSRYYFLLGIAGFVINWFGDSLDGRLAYFRNKPRKWYGFSLDLLIDWLSTVLIGLGYIIYADGWWKMAGFGFVTMYGWAMLIAVIRYKVTGKYTIDSGLFGPTEVRIMIAAIMVAEIFFKGTLLYFATIVSGILFLVNVFDTYRLLCFAHERDKTEKETI
jgi:hypothetical protein